MMVALHLFGCCIGQPFSKIIWSVYFWLGAECLRITRRIMRELPAVTQIGKNWSVLFFSLSLRTSVSQLSRSQILNFFFFFKQRYLSSDLLWIGLNAFNTDAQIRALWLISDLHFLWPFDLFILSLADPSFSKRIIL